MAGSLIAAGIGAAGSIIGGNKQADAVSDSAAINREIAELNAELTREENQKLRDFTKQENDIQRAIAERILQIQLGGTQDALGNRVFFDEDLGGFTTQLSQEGKLLQDLSTREQLLQALVDKGRQRRGEARNEERRIQIGDAADSTLRQLQQPGTPREALKAAIMRSRLAGINRGFDEVTDAVNTIGLRSGQDSSKELSRLARNRSADVQQALADAELGSFDAFESLEGARQSRLGNLFTNLNSQASNTQNAAFAPPSLLDTLAQRAGAATQGVVSAGNLFQGTKGASSVGAPQVNFQQPVGQDGLALNNTFQNIAGLINTPAISNKINDFFGTGTTNQQPAQTNNNNRFLGNQ